MRHHDRNRKLGREDSQRLALLRSLAVSLIEHGKITTTEAKAKELRPFVERLVTYGKSGTLASRRLTISRLGGNEDATKELFDTIAGKYKDRQGGYTRISKLGPRGNDAAAMAVIEFV